jgi:hypothetical protein
MSTCCGFPTPQALWRGSANGTKFHRSQRNDCRAMSRESTLRQSLRQAHNTLPLTRKGTAFLVSSVGSTRTDCLVSSFAFTHHQNHHQTQATLLRSAGQLVSRGRAFLVCSSSSCSSAYTSQESCATGISLESSDTGVEPYTFHGSPKEHNSGKCRRPRRPWFSWTGPCAERQQCS